MARPSSVVFAYSNVGARCLRVLRAHDVDVKLVVTHADNPRETLWFERVADVASGLDIPVVKPADPNTPAFIAEIAAFQPDFIFSFYYRQMLSTALLDLAPRGAFNMHGSLLPKFRGRAPVNWAVLYGARETGATLHVMTAKPDAGDIVDQTAVPILPDDTAREVFDKVCVAAEITLDRVLPALVAGTAPRIPMDLTAGSYYGARRPEDGRIDWMQDAQRIHNLVRAVAPPYPGATTMLGMHPARVLRTRVVAATGPAVRPTLQMRDGKFFAHCGGGGVLHIVDLELDGRLVTPDAIVRVLGSGTLPLDEG